MNPGDATILVVDDEPVLRLTFSLLIKQLGAKVHTAANGLEALEVLAREHIDAMLTDRQMPLMNGRDLLETLYARGASIPSVFFVSAVDPDSAEDMTRLGVVETLTKPLHPERLKHVLQQVLLGLPVAAAEV